MNSDVNEKDDLATSVTTPELDNAKVVKEASENLPDEHLPPGIKEI